MFNSNNDDKKNRIQVRKPFSPNPRTTFGSGGSNSMFNEKVDMALREIKNLKRSISRWGNVIANEEELVKDRKGTRIFITTISGTVYKGFLVDMSKFQIIISQNEDGSNEQFFYKSAVIFYTFE